MMMGRHCRGGEDCARFMPLTTYCRSVSPVGFGRLCLICRRRRAEMYSMIVECLTEEDRKVREEAGMEERWY